MDYTFSINTEGVGYLGGRVDKIGDRTRRRHKLISGFTIVELLIVIVVIAILAALSYVGYTSMQNRAYDARTRDGAAKYERAVRAWMVDNPTLLIGNAGSVAPIANGLCSDGGGSGFTAANACTTEQMLSAAGHLPADFVRSLPSNIYYGGNSDGRYSLMQYACLGSSRKWILFWTLRQPSHADTENLYDLMTSCGHGDGAGPSEHSIVKNWGMRAAKIVEL